jgi:hypothetical protein
MSSGSEIWPNEMYEPLTIGIAFPFLPIRPWQIRGTPKMLHLGRTLPALLKDLNMVTGNRLCEIMQPDVEITRLARGCGVASAIFLIPPSCLMSNKEKVLSARMGHHMIKKELYGLGETSIDLWMSIWWDVMVIIY